MCSEPREASPAAEIGLSGFRNNIYGNVRINTLVVFSLGTQKCAQHCSEDNHGFAEKSCIYFHRSVVCFPLESGLNFAAFFCVLCSVNTILCFQSSFSLPQIYRGSMRGKMKWSNIFCLSSSCCQLSLSGTISHFMTHYLTWVSFAPLSVYQAEFLNRLLWLAIHPETGKCAFIYSVTLGAFKAFLPSPLSISWYLWELSRAGSELYLCWHN